MASRRRRGGGARLLARGGLSATAACGQTHWPEEAEKLKALAGERRLRGRPPLVLTDQAPAAMPRRPRWAAAVAAQDARAGERTGPRGPEIAAEMERQLDRFEAAGGRPPLRRRPQHAHQLPVIRQALLGLYDRRLRRHGTRVRYCTRPVADILAAGVAVPRTLVIAGLGRAWARLGRAAGVPGNRHFAGVRGAAERRPFGEQLKAWLTTARPGTLIMCHPGSVEEALIAADPLTTPREGEYAFLAGDGLPRLLAETNAVLVPPGRLPGNG